MSWLSAVTGKAEDFLNKLDRSAADVLHVDEPKAKVKPEQPPVQVINEPLLSPSLTPSQSVPARLNFLKEDTERSKTPSHTNTLASSPLQQAPGKNVKKKNSDEALFDFLNSKESLEASKKRRTPVSSQHHSRQSSTSSLVSATSKGTKLEGTAVIGSDASTAFTPVTQIKLPADSTDDGPRQDSPTNSHTSADLEAIADAMKESPAGSDQSAPDSDHADMGAGNKDRQLSSLELENRLLRNEVASLNDEMASVITRAKDAETELKRAKEKLKAQLNSASMHDQLVRELQSRELDLTEALKAKDAQLAVLRVRLEEADKRLLSKEKTLEEVKLERERILRDHTDSSGLHSQALDSMKEKLEEVEAALRREQTAYKQAQQEASQRQSKLEQEQRAMAESLTLTEKKLSEEKIKITELSTQIKVAKSAADSARKELTEYKDKAARILQSKEKLISSMKDSSSGIGDTGAGVSMLEHESLRQERDMLREELQQAKLTIDNLRTELQDLETQLQLDSDTTQETIRSLEDSLREEKRRKEDAEQELLKHKQELQYTTEELYKQKTAFQSRISDRETEIEKLRNQLMTKSMSTSTENELESRVRALTESLIQKQTVLEALSTEKNSLVLQLERMEHQYRELENAAPRTTSTTQLVAVSDHDDEVKQRLPMFLREVPTDHEVTRRMKRAANSIDGFSIRLGVFLRRYPMARVFVILYMALLHLWVLIVMMTYQPEMHGLDYQPQAPKGGE
ncbi:golgin subfamily A member 5-like isoform X1 [Biomphalaria glabrata]|uniref:Golgin subfamily A member 5-like isoform X1 n=1 Tax=Biomphalaria glabrata TaxID=6526 RepID=A0A9W2ZZ40_BIOGL|nr:golgin subfamily A member 5-like isoform X1 [Biomphalaria glabrata]XP_013084245.2 golgin subfamily A member 5-like isoform X1 [Biomphalaria glabrata]XP_055880307.1 golgin subfamily A member 5-like isoform X1 [Biomphalaria glabrata]